MINRFSSINLFEFFLFFLINLFHIILKWVFQTIEKRIEVLLEFIREGTVIDCVVNEILFL